MSEISAELSPEAKLGQNMEKLKDSAPYKEQYKDPEVQQLMQALDIFATLRVDLAKDSSRIPWKKIRSAQEYLDQMFKKRFDEEKHEE